MTLLFSLLPLYIFGNLHCLGMCGPLVLMIGHHRYRYLYFLGRTLSFSLAGGIAGEAGAVLNIFLRTYHIPALASFCFGALILLIGLFALTGWTLPTAPWFSLRIARFNRSLSHLILRDQPWPSFLFGFFTLALPCGQTLIVFSAIALYGDPLIGLMNGCLFALLTSPALVAAMHAHRLFHTAKKHYNMLMGLCALFIGVLALCRGFAELNLIPHLVLNPQADSHYHIVIY